MMLSTFKAKKMVNIYVSKDVQVNLYYIDIGEGKPDGYCYFNSVQNNQRNFSILDQK
jgi:hypothetical protein